MKHAERELLRRLMLHDEHALNRVMSARAKAPAVLDDKTAALVKVASLVALEAGDASYQCAVDAVHAAGAEDGEIIDVLLAIAPIVGVARVNAAAPTLAMALGYDLDSG